MCVCVCVCVCVCMCVCMWCYWGLDGRPCIAPEEGGEGGVRVLMGGLGVWVGEGGRGEGMWCY